MGCNSRNDLAELVGKALAMADELDLAEVGLRVDRADRRGRRAARYAAALYGERTVLRLAAYGRGA